MDPARTASATRTQGQAIDADATLLREMQAGRCPRNMRIGAGECLREKQRPGAEARIGCRANGEARPTASCWTCQVRAVSVGRWPS